MNHSPKPRIELVDFATKCCEAARRHGDDWRAVNTQIKKCVDALPKEQRERLANELDRVLRYYAPDGGGRAQ